MPEEAEQEGLLQQLHVLAARDWIEYAYPGYRRRDLPPGAYSAVSIEASILQKGMQALRTVNKVSDRAFASLLSRQAAADSGVLDRAVSHVVEALRGKHNCATIDLPLLAFLDRVAQHPQAAPMLDSKSSVLELVRAACSQMRRTSGPPCHWAKLDARVASIQETCRGTTIATLKAARARAQVEAQAQAQAGRPGQAAAGSDHRTAAAKRPAVLEELRDQSKYLREVGEADAFVEMLRDLARRVTTATREPASSTSTVGAGAGACASATAGAGAGAGAGKDGAAKAALSPAAAGKALYDVLDGWLLGAIAESRIRRGQRERCYRAILQLAIAILDADPAEGVSALLSVVAKHCPGCLVVSLLAMVALHPGLEPLVERTMRAMLGDAAGRIVERGEVRVLAAQLRSAYKRRGKPFPYMARGICLDFRLPFGTSPASINNMLGSLLASRCLRERMRDAPAAALRDVARFLRHGGVARSELDSEGGGRPKPADWPAYEFDTFVGH